MKISVVIPSHDRKEKLRAAVDSITSQNFQKKDYELIIVTDSEDGTIEMLKQIQKSSPVQIKYFRKKSDGPSQKRNLGIKNASGEIVAFMDDDCVADKNWLKNMNASFRAGIGAVEGKTTTDKKNIGPFTHYILNETGGQYMTCNMAYRRSLLKYFGGFDENFTNSITINREDSDLAFSILEKGHAIAFAKDAIVEHPAVRTKFINRLKKKKEFFVDPLLYRKHPKLYKERIRFPFELFTPFYVASVLLSFLSPIFILLLPFIAGGELVRRKWRSGLYEFIKFTVLQTAGSFVIVAFYLYGCIVFRTNPLRPLVHF